MTKISEYANSHDLTKKGLFDISEDTSVAQDGTSYESKSLRKSALIDDILSNVPDNTAVTAIILNPLDGSIIIQQNGLADVIMQAPALQNYIDGRISNGGGGDLLSTNNLSDVADTSVSRTNLGLEIGSDVQAFSAILQNTTASFTTALETEIANNTAKVGITPTQATDIVTNNSKGIAASGTGAAFSLDNINGTFYNMSAANSATSYIASNLVLGCYAVGLINAATEPTVAGATKILGSDFIPNTDMHLWVQYFGVTVQYFFAEL